MDEKGGPPPYVEAAQSSQGSNYNTNYGPPIGQSEPGDYQYAQQQTQYQYPQVSVPTQQGLVVTQQPMISQNQVMQVPDNMGMAIFATICCFWPLGILAILKASESKSALMRGDVQGAVTLASDSRRMSLIAIGVGVGLMVVMVIVLVSVLVSVNHHNHY